MLFSGATAINSGCDVAYLLRRESIGAGQLFVGFASVETFEDFEVPEKKCNFFGEVDSVTGENFEDLLGCLFSDFIGEQSVGIKAFHD